MTNSPIRFNKRLAPWGPFVFVADLAWVLISGIGTCWLLSFHPAGNHLWPFSDQYRAVVAGVAVVFVLLMELLGGYRPWRGGHLFDEIRIALLSWASAFVIFAGLAFLMKAGAQFSRLWMGSWLIVGITGSIGIRIVLRKSLRWLRQRGWDTKNIVLVGGGQLGDRVVHSLNSNGWLGFRILGFFEEDKSKLRSQDIAYLGTYTKLESYIKEHSVHQVWILLPLSAHEQIQMFAENLDASSVEVRLVPDIFSYRLLNHSVESVVGMPVINLNASPQTGIDASLKRLMDICGALIALVIFSPIMFVAALAITMTSPGPIIFRQERLGWDGHQFSVYKFRTMFEYADNPSAPYRQAQKKDRRITKIGGVLRRTSIDELPQLINVLIGNMSLVGPRPHPTAMSDQVKDTVDRYMTRHKVKPGITGWAQVNGFRGETNTKDKLEGRINHDLYYIENWSLFLDIKIILLTILSIFVDDKAY